MLHDSKDICNRLDTQTKAHIAWAF